MRMRVASLCSSLLLLATGVFAADHSHYWSGGRTIALRPDPTSLVVVFREPSAAGARSRRARGFPLLCRREGGTP